MTPLGTTLEFSKPFVSSEAQLFPYSLKMPIFVLIRIHFNQKHCILYLYLNGHVWDPIYEFAICGSVINMNFNFNMKYDRIKGKQKYFLISQHHWSSTTSHPPLLHPPPWPPACPLLPYTFHPHCFSKVKKIGN